MRKKINLLLRYERMGSTIKRLEAERQRIRDIVEENGNRMQDDGWIGVIKEQTRRSMAPLEVCSQLLGDDLMKKPGLVKTITYNVLVVSRIGRKTA